MLYSYHAPLFFFPSFDTFWKLAAARNSSNNKLLIIVHYLQILLTNSCILAYYLAKSFGKSDAKESSDTISDYLRYF